MKEEGVTLATLAGGAAEEAFRVELQKVLENIVDPNTKPEAVRSITLKMDIKPTANRELGVVTVQCHSKLAGAKPLTAQMFIGRQNGQVVGVEHDPKQADMFKEEPAIRKPAPLRSVAGGGVANA